MAIIYIKGEEGWFTWCLAEKLLTPDLTKHPSECVWLVPGTISP